MFQSRLSTIRFIKTCLLACFFFFIIIIIIALVHYHATERVFDFLGSNLEVLVGKVELMGLIIWPSMTCPRHMSAIDSILMPSRSLSLPSSFLFPWWHWFTCCAKKTIPRSMARSAIIKDKVLANSFRLSSSSSISLLVNLCSAKLFAGIGPWCSFSKGTWSSSNNDIMVTDDGRANDLTFKEVWCINIKLSICSCWLQPIKTIRGKVWPINRWRWYHGFVQSKLCIHVVMGMDGLVILQLCW